MSLKENSSAPNIQPPPHTLSKSKLHTFWLPCSGYKNIWQQYMLQGSWSVFGSQFCQTVHSHCAFISCIYGLFILKAIYER